MISNEEFSRAVEASFRAMDKDIKFKADWIPTRMSWLLSATIVFCNQRAITYVYATNDELEEAIAWVERVAGSIFVPGAFRFVVLDTKPPEQLLEESNHVAITTEGFSP